MKPLRRAQYLCEFSLARLLIKSFLLVIYTILFTFLVFPPQGMTSDFIEKKRKYGKVVGYV